MKTTKAEREALRHEAWLELARKDFTVFKRRIYKRYMHAPHLKLIDQALEDAVTYVESAGRAGCGFTMINMPPRFGKTLTASRMFPAWVIGNHPDWRIIMASYGATLATKNSRVARNIVASQAYAELFPGVRLAQDSKAADAWDVQGHEGGLDAIGVGGGVTGKGGQIILIDDVVKSREEAESATIRDKIWDWYRDDLYTRREPNAAIVLIMTRWHEDDLAGRLMLHEPDKWRVLSLPAIGDDGQALWPARYPLEALQDIERTLGPYSWSALYQQRPAPAEGGIFKRAWFSIVSEPPPIARAARFWDLAMSEKTSADYTAGVKIGQGADGHFYVLDVKRARVDWGNLTEYLSSVILEDGANVPQGIEQKGYMSRAIQSLNADPRFHGYAIWGYPKDKDKLTNALPLAAKAAAGLLHLVRSHWTDAFLDELTSFPNAAHDDQVDAAAGAWTMLDESEDVTGELGYADAAQFSTSPY